ncbi:Zinc finger, AD-type [Cinara cedri]|uniref:Zinc finger, AD-type n=1 Tax=Cinara cedri TaxID=506608 RepID=A0A5E4ND14_9HEMI|nr:Zinc finger, AD-type [Cinara cedri]
MGSVNNAVRCGFICRLCSKIDKRVVHIYGELGRKYNLVQKIRDYLPIKIKSSDGLPLTLCVSCVQRLNRRHSLQMALLKNNSARVLARTSVQSDTERSESECNQQIQFSPAAVQSI